MEDRGGKHRGSVALGHAFDKVIKRADAAAGDHRDFHRIGDGAGERQVEPGFRAVTVHRGEQDLACALRLDVPGERDRVDAGGFAPAMGKDLPAARFHGLGIDGDNDALAAEAIGGFGHHIGIGDGGGVEADLVGPRQKQRADVLMRAHAAADGQRHEALFGGAGHQIEHRAAVFMRGVDVEETQLVGACRVIGLGGLDRVARVDQIDEVHAFHHAAIGHVEAGNDARLEHGALLWRLSSGRLAAWKASSGALPRTPGYLWQDKTRPLYLARNIPGGVPQGRGAAPP